MSLKLQIKGRVTRLYPLRGVTMSFYNTYEIADPLFLYLLGIQHKQRIVYAMNF